MFRPASFSLKRLLGGAIFLILSAAAAGTYAWAVYREAVLESVENGMTPAEVESILGPPIEEDRIARGFPSDCAMCPQADREIVYKGNQSLWLGRLEDRLFVCYRQNQVCDKYHVGL